MLNWVKSRISTMLTAGATGQWWFGVYNGLLPCGLTYVALATAISTGSLFNAVIYMVIFGIGTSPMMWTVVTGFNSLRLKRGFGNKIIAGFTWMLAVLLIIRGLGLGIPYLSPDAGHQHEIHTSNNH